MFHKKLDQKIQKAEVCACVWHCEYCSDAEKMALI